jgi:predicted RNA methylase
MSSQPYLSGLESEERKRELSQFYTPRDLALRVWQWALYSPRYALDVLEPSCGDGALIAPLIELGVNVRSVRAFDIDPRNAERVRRRFSELGNHLVVYCEDFLAADVGPCGSDEICVMNPPYENGLDVAFAIKCLDVCSRVVGIFRADIFYSIGRRDFWDWTDPVRGALLSRRPHFGGEHSAMTDFCVLELKRRESKRKQGEPTISKLEWW